MNPEFQVHEFRTPYSQKFHLYLKAIRPYFILTHDGSTLKHGNSSNLSRMTLQKGILLGFMRHIMSINITIGLMQEVDFQNSKVRTVSTVVLVYIAMHKTHLFRRFSP